MTFQCEAMTKANGKIAPYRCLRPATHSRDGQRVCQAHWKQRAKTEKRTAEPRWKNGPWQSPVCSTGLFRYARHEDIQKYKADGWVIVDDFSGTHHAAYAVLMGKTEP